MEGDVLMHLAFWWFLLVCLGAIVVVVLGIYVNIAPLIGIAP